jgi:hypothetical protein
VPTILEVEPAAWSPPAEFDDLELIRPLGAGGMGAVFLARERRLDRLVAVKFVATGTRDPHAAARFRIEARALARLQHPNIVAGLSARRGRGAAVPRLRVRRRGSASITCIGRWAGRRSWRSCSGSPAAWRRLTPPGSCIAISSRPT